MNTTRQLLLGRGRRGGFTMVEIILVVVIIMTLAAVVGPRLVGKSKRAKINTTKIQMSAIKTMLQEFETHSGRFPTTQEGLDALVTRPSGLTENEWPDKYVEKVPLDSFQHPFKYVCPSEHGGDYDLISPGPDGQLGTADDITNFDNPSGSTSGSTPKL